MNSQFLNEDQVMIQEMAYDFAAAELAPFASEWDKTKHFPKDQYVKAGELGMAGIYVSEEYGGSGLGRLEASLIFEALSTGKFLFLTNFDIGCVGSSAYISIHNMCAGMIDKFGTTEQKDRWLRDLCSLNLFTSYCLTEPDSGSDAQAMKSYAKDMGDHFVLNGSKAFISGAGETDLYFVMCKTGENEVSCLVVENGTEGLSFGANEHKMGWNVQPTRMVMFDDVKVPKANMLGE